MFFFFQILLVGCGGTTSSAGCSVLQVSSAFWWVTNTTALTWWSPTLSPPAPSGRTTPWPTHMWVIGNLKFAKKQNHWLIIFFCFVFASQSLRQAPNNFLSRTWWNPIFNFLEKNVQTTVPIKFSWPVTLLSSCRQRYRIVEGGRDEWDSCGKYWRRTDWSISGLSSQAQRKPLNESYKLWTNDYCYICLTVRGKCQTYRGGTVNLKHVQLALT